jgi:hypothetical protein
MLMHQLLLGNHRSHSYCHIGRQAAGTLHCSAVPTPV